MTLISRSPIHKIIIKPPNKNIWSNLLAIWQHRTFLFYLANYAMHYRYKETILGWFWSVIRVLVPVLVFNLIFGELTNFQKSDSVPYFLFIITGMSIWNFLSRSLVEVTKSLKTLKKVSSSLYFPKILIPIASISPAFVELETYLGLIILANFFFFFTDGKLFIYPSWKLIFSVFFMFLSTLLIYGIGFFTSILYIKTRDIRFLLPFIIQFWFYATPVIYPLSFLDPHLRQIISLNPMTIIVEGFRWSLFGTGELDFVRISICLCIVSIIFFLSLYYFINADSDKENFLDFDE